MVTRVTARNVRAFMMCAAVIAASGLTACQPAPPPPGQDPVIIAAGAFAPEFSQEPLATRLRAEGFDVYIYVVPTPLDGIEETAPSLATFIQGVLDSTGATKVDIVNHSQSGLLTRHVIKYLGMANKIDTVVSLSGLHHGSALASLPPLLGVPDCLGVEICVQLESGSDYLTALNSPTEAIGNIHYVNIGSVADVLAVPYDNNFMYGTGDITNVLVQSQCPLRLPGHLAMIVNGTVASGVIDGLKRQPITLDCFAL